jgi:hypothetical protein
MYFSHSCHKDSNRLVILYDLFTANIIPCLSGNRGCGLCSGHDCKLAHINDSYKEASEYGNINYNYIEISRQKFKEWNHQEYLKTRNIFKN